MTSYGSFKKRERGKHRGDFILLSANPVCLHGFCAGGHCADHEDAQTAEAPAAPGGGPQPAVLALQASRPHHQGKGLHPWKRCCSVSLGSVGK